MQPDVRTFASSASVSFEVALRWRDPAPELLPVDLLFDPLMDDDSSNGSSLFFRSAVIAEPPQVAAAGLRGWTGNLRTWKSRVRAPRSRGRSQAALEARLADRIA